MPANLSSGQCTAITPEAKLSQGVSANTDLIKRGAGLSRGPKGLVNANAPWTNTWPAAGASLDIDFVNDRSFIKGVGTGSAMQNLTFTRASSGTYIDSTGTLQTAGNNVRRLDWLNTPPARNLLTYTGDLSNTTGWGLTATTFSNGCLFETATTSPHNIAQTVFGGVVSTGIFTLSVEVFPNGRDLINISTGASSAVYSVNYTFSTNTFSSIGTSVLSYSSTVLSDGYVRITLTTNTTNTFRISPSTGGANYLGDVTKGVYIRNPQIEYGSTATPYQYIYTNLPLITPLQAASTVNGYLCEESRTNNLLWCRDATNAAWVKTTMTVAKDQTGIDDVANACSSLTATSANGVCIQTVTATSASKTASVYLKRITGTGTIQVTMDGITYVTVDLSNGIWNRIVISATLANPTVGIKIVTSGDAVALDYGQIEAGGMVTTPILTTTASATRALDVASMIGANFNSWFNQDKGSFYVEYYCYSTSTMFVFGTAPFNANTGVGIQLGTNIAYFIRGFGSAPNSSINLAMFNKTSGSYDSWLIKISVNNKQTTELANQNRNFSTSFLIGQRGDLSSFYTGYIRRIVYFPKALSSNALQNLTS